MDTAKSDNEFNRAKQVIPGGVNSPARAFSSVSDSPVFADEASGVKLKDIDGNEYVDFSGSWGPLILGHAPDAVINDLEERLQQSTSFGIPTVVETKLAEKIISHMPAMDKIRFVNSGTEATMSAIRLARGVTNRKKMIKFRGCYHGHGDSLLVEAGSGLLTHGTPSSPGITEETAENTIVLPFNDAEAVEKLFTEKGSEIAGAIVEPVAGNMGVIPPKEHFLSTLREQTEQHDAALILDEVITGFRLGFGGAQEQYDIEPDLTTLGKVIGGGMPVGAFGGTNEYMQHLSPEGDVYQAGTLSGNPISMQAGLSTLTLLEEQNPYDELDRKSKWFCSEVKDRARQIDIPLTINRVGSMISLFFQEGPVENQNDANQCDLDRFSRFHHEMLKQGMYLPPSQFETIFINVPHTENHLQKALDAIEKAFSEIKQS